MMVFEATLVASKLSSYYPATNRCAVIVSFSESGINPRPAFTALPIDVIGISFRAGLTQHGVELTHGHSGHDLPPSLGLHALVSSFQIGAV